MIAQSDPSNLIRLEFVNSQTQVGQLGNSAILEQTQLELNEYFKRTRSHFTISIAPSGTDFQQKVWAQLQAIPYGKTIHYAQLAQQLGNP